MTHLRSVSAAAQALAEPKPLFIWFSARGEIVLFVEDGTSLTDINRLNQIAATVLVEEGYTVTDTTVGMAEGPNPLKHMVLRLKLNKGPDWYPLHTRLIQVLEPSHTIPATLGTQYRPSKLTHYRIVLPLAYKEVNWQQAFADNSSPRGMETNGYEAEFWLTDASSLEEIWHEAQQLASKLNAFLISTGTFGRSLTETQ